ncbi:hypothetical protein [Caproicibacter sp.]|uniref:hypothetical protein n=1 Tax=Caproicibacter sp. TaxID=2814884 RepID=UPI0039891AE2
MDAETRKAKLTELRANENNVAMTGIPLRYKGSTLTVKVYRIPLVYLVYNKYNGRIGTEIKSYETQYGSLDPENRTDSLIIEDFLYKSKEDRNRVTMESLQRNRQQRYGIVTADGIIIDGNRRAMLLNRLFRNRGSEIHKQFSLSEVDHCQYFLAIILPDNAEEKDIQQLETIYQMGEDDKLDYNPIQKYLKCKELKRFFDVDAIADFMGEKPGTIREWLSILKLMEEYLDEYGYSGIYTRLEKTEGPFVDLNSYLDSYKKHVGSVSQIDWNYTDSDISDLKLVCFDYIRARYEGKEFRDIAKTGKDGSLFFHHDLWTDFFKKHSDTISTISEPTVEELRTSHPSEDLPRLLKSRDNAWTEATKGELEGNLRRNVRKLEDKRDANKPRELLTRALSALKSVDQEQDSFLHDPNILDMVKEINKITWEMKKVLD